VHVGIHKSGINLEQDKSGRETSRGKQIAIRISDGFGNQRRVDPPSVHDEYHVRPCGSCDLRLSNKGPDSDTAGGALNGNQSRGKLKTVNARHSVPQIIGRGNTQEWLAIAKQPEENVAMGERARFNKAKDMS
jgi:hypothetical protein